MSAIIDLFRHFLAPTELHTLYPATVVRQNQNGTLELTVDDPRIVSLSDVPIRYGVPGISCKIRAGARVSVEFERGQKDRPVATVWESASVESVTVSADCVYIGSDSDDPRMVSRDGDYVFCYLPSPMALAGAVAGLGAFTGAMTPVEPMVGVITGESSNARA